MIRSHPNVRTPPLMSGTAALLLGLSWVCGLVPDSALAQGTAPVVALPDGMEARTHEDIYQEYNRAGLELSPLYQIESWLGYLKLHPDTPYRDLVRLKLRYLAAALTPQQEQLLLAMLAMEGLVDQINAISDARLKQEAVSDYLGLHPSIAQSRPHVAMLEELLRRLNVKDPAQFIAKKLEYAPLQPSTPTELEALSNSGATTAAPITAAASSESLPASSAANASADAGSSQVAIQSTPGNSTAQGPLTVPPAPAVEESTSAKTTSASGTTMPVKQPDHGNTATGGGSGAASTTVASIPKPEPPSLEATLTGLVRLKRWREGMAGMSEESQRQMWITYLLLYPDGPEAREAEAELKQANEAYETARRDKALREEALAAELEQGRAYQTQVSNLEQKLALRQTLMILGTVLLGILLITPL